MTLADKKKSMTSTMCKPLFTIWMLTSQKLFSEAQRDCYGKIQFKYFSYRVEFQARGMPHIHGVAWISPDYLKEKDIDGFDLCVTNEDKLVIFCGFANKDFFLCYV